MMWPQSYLTGKTGITQVVYGLFAFNLSPLITAISEHRNVIISRRTKVYHDTIVQTKTRVADYQLFSIT